MPTFAYKAKSSPETVLQGVVEAPDRGQAIAKLRTMGYRLLSLEEASASARGGGAVPGQGRIGSADVAMFWRQLASLLEAGLPLVPALRTVEAQTENRRLLGVVSGVRQAVEGACSFSQALGRYPRAFGPLFVSIVATGEATGTLAQVVGQLAEKIEKQQDLRSKVRSALVYPVFLSIVGVLVVTVLVAFVVPKFATLFHSMGQELPLATRALLGVSEFIGHYGWLLAAALLLAGLAAYRATRSGGGRLAMHQFQLHLPVIGKVIRKVEMARFAHTFGTLVASGVNILSALEITARTVSNQVIAREILLARDRIAKGSRVEAALRRGRFFPPALVNMVAVGEDSSSLDKMLDKVATVYERDSDRLVGTMTRLLESALILMLGAMIGLVVAAILLPIFQASAFAE